MPWCCLIVHEGKVLQGAAGEKNRKKEIKGDCRLFSSFSSHFLIQFISSTTEL